MSSTINKALMFLEVLAEREEPWSISELSRRLKLTKSNVHFHLAALCGNGYVIQDPETRRYQLTLKLWEIGSRVLGRLDLRRVALPFLTALSKETSESVSLAILDHHDVLYIHRIDSSMPVRVYSPEGNRAPAHCTSTGKILLAYAPEDLVKQVLANPRRYTDRTIMSEKHLLDEFQKIRKDGYSMNRGEWRDMVSGVAAPIFGGDGMVVAAVGVFGPSGRLPLRRLPPLASMVIRTTNAISAALGSESDSHAASGLRQASG